MKPITMLFTVFYIYSAYTVWAIPIIIWYSMTGDSLFSCDPAVPLSSEIEMALDGFRYKQHLISLKLCSHGSSLLNIFFLVSILASLVGRTKMKGKDTTEGNEKQTDAMPYYSAAAHATTTPKPSQTSFLYSTFLGIVDLMFTYTDWPQC